MGLHLDYGASVFDPPELIDVPHGEHLPLAPVSIFLLLH